jgi:hypothetical protein
MKALLHVGADRGAIVEARKTVLMILNVRGVGDEVKIQALKTFERVCNVDNMSITGCTFTNNPTKK